MEDERQRDSGVQVIEKESKGNKLKQLVSRTVGESLAATVMIF